MAKREEFNKVRKEDELERKLISVRRVVKVVKGGVAKLAADLQTYSVDAISGGTITSQGVNNMIENVLGSYLPYIEKQ